jgi:hypothetical protein
MTNFNFDVFQDTPESRAQHHKRTGVYHTPFNLRRDLRYWPFSKEHRRCNAGSRVSTEWAKNICEWSLPSTDYL